ncbi:cyanoexosortase A [Lyngbya aestuarii]|uniref:cyanoexosortase A n=1 Tax=Lyngbya aestuarii TaxID=118322 RepID=UPI00403DB157
MKTFSLLSAIKGSQFLLLGIATGLITIHLSLTERIDGSSVSSIGLLFWLAAASLIWQKRNSLNLESDVFSSFLGILLIAVVLLRSSSPQLTTHFLGAFPFLSGLGLALLASGFKGLRQYWQELLLLFFLGVPKAAIFPVIDISVVTAKFAAVMMWYTGFDVFQQGVTVMLPGGGVNVQPFCSGLRGIFYLLGLSVLTLVMFPVSGVKKYFVPIIAMILAFVVNGVRVVIMAFFASTQNQKVLAYWHDGQGSLVFTLMAVMLFGLFYFFLLRQEGIQDQTDVDSSRL